MRKYIAVDVHDQSCVAVVLDQNGKETKWEVLDTSGAAIREFLRGVSGEKYAVIEEGTLSQWLCETIAPFVDELKVTVPEKRRSGQQKSDLEDARRLANALRLGALKTIVYKPPRQYAELRCTVRTYQTICRDSTRAKLRLRTVFRSRAIRAGDAIYDPEQRNDQLKLLPPAERQMAEVYAQEVDQLGEILEQAGRDMAKASRSHPAVKLLQTAPGIGPIRAATIAAVVVDPHRFRTTRQFWSYCGLGIVMHSSADWVRDDRNKCVHGQVFRTRGLNRNRNAWLKNVFKGAATGLLMRSPEHPLVQGYQRRTAAGMKPNLAALTLARQIAAIVLSMWKNQKEYDPARQALPAKNAD